MCKNGKLLLVDANPISRDSLKKILLDVGHMVYDTSSVDEALNLSNSEKPDLVILDIHLPDLAGIDLASELLDSGIPFIFLCQSSEIVKTKLAHLADSQDNLEKTYNYTNQLPAIDAALTWAKEFQRLKDTETRYTRAIETGRVVDVVVGILMERHHLERERAFDMLRNKARSERKKLRDLAQEILDAISKVNKLSP
ncbi:MAG: response regulator [Candidatus Thiodiazotropha sp. (ex Monitilora ramsayi)]|nr:response regulator [Candidatus Thiodiazotropha sp. (ex Monitilora ramsayi)]